MSLKRLLSERRPLVVAHRGASGYAPENTMAAYRLALEQGADGIEIDVHLSREGVPVIIHDHTLGRTTSGKGRVSEKGLEELKALDAGAWFGQGFAGERLPTLEEVLAWAKGRLAVHIEVKNNPVRYTGIEERVVEMVQRYGLVEDVEVFSFDHTCARRVKELCPDLLVGVCYYADPLDHAGLARSAGADTLHPHWHNVRRDAVEEAHRAGLFVITWTVNEPEDALHLVGMGVDAIKTDYPGPIREALVRAGLR